MDVFTCQHCNAVPVKGLRTCLILSIGTKFTMAGLDENDWLAWAESDATDDRDDG